MNLQFCESITGKQLDEFTRSSCCNNIYQTEGWAQVKKSGLPSMSACARMVNYAVQR